MIQHTLTTGEAFEFEAGGKVSHLSIGYHTSEVPFGSPEFSDGKGGDTRKVILIFHALTANSDVQDWWPELVGKEKLIDTDKYFVFCVNMLGSCYGSLGPSSTNPETGKPYFFNFPKVTVRDIVRGIDIVREAIGVKEIDLIIGSSIGGLQALEYTYMFPERVKRAVYIATSARVTPFLSATIESQKMALEADSTFRECGSLDGGKTGLKCARSIAMLSYRCPAGYNLTQQDKDDDTLFAERAGSYQRYQGEKFSKRFDAYSYWYLSNAVISANIGRGRGGCKAALSTFNLPSDIICVDSDLIFTIPDMEFLARNISGSRFHVIKSNFGHDGFLVENDHLSAILSPILNEL